MKNQLVFLLIILPQLVFGSIKGDSPSIVFVHLGSKLPTYLPTAVQQARLFNQCNVILIASSEAMEPHKKWIEDHAIFTIDYYTLTPSKEHKYFLEKTHLSRDFRDGFCLFTSERFFCLEEAMRQYNLRQVIHLESDVMLYEDIETLIPLFKSQYQALAVPFDNDARSVPSLIYIQDADALSHYTHIMAKKAEENMHDMYLFALLKNEYGPTVLDTLPIVCQEYIENETVDSQDPHQFCRHVDTFNSVFDAAYLGQYLGGVDPRNKAFLPRGESGRAGYISPDCLINAAKLHLFWQKDEKGRRTPYLKYMGKSLKINNLHIHSKHLKPFRSLRSFPLRLWDQFCSKFYWLWLLPFGIITPFIFIRKRL